MTVTTTIDLTTQTPAEIDTALAAIWDQWYTADLRARLMADDLRKNRKRAEKTLEKTPNAPWVIAEITRAEEALAAAEAKAEALEEAMFPYHAEFDRRGGWTRAWKVTNVGGHIHSSMHCQTCFITTSFAWLPQVSGHPEAEIVELAASAACTICYPSAPVDKPTQLFTKSEQEAQAERDRKAQAKIEREAKRLAKALLPTGEPLLLGDGRRYRERIETLAAARGWLTDSFMWGSDHPSFPPEWVAQVSEAVAAKEGKTTEAVLAEAEKRAKKRR